MDREIVRAALRTAKEADATDQEWRLSTGSPSAQRNQRGAVKQTHEKSILPRTGAGADRRDVIIAYDPRLYYGSPQPFPLRDIIEGKGWCGVSIFWEKMGKFWGIIFSFLSTPTPDLEGQGQGWGGSINLGAIIGGMGGGTTAMIFFPSRGRHHPHRLLSLRRGSIYRAAALYLRP